MTDAEKIRASMDVIERYGQIEGDHHSKWVIDQVARILMGDLYPAWVIDMRDGEDGPDTYSYDEGIAP